MQLQSSLDPTGTWPELLVYLQEQKLLTPSVETFT